MSRFEIPPGDTSSFCLANSEPGHAKHRLSSQCETHRASFTLAKYGFWCHTLLLNKTPSFRLFTFLDAPFRALFRPTGGVLRVLFGLRRSGADDDDAFSKCFEFAFDFMSVVAVAITCAHVF